MTFHRFEDITAWQSARKVVKAIYDVSNDGDFGRDFGLRDQIRRAAVSIMVNIAEGCTRRSNREFVQFLFTAKASIAEVQSHLYVALDQGYLTRKEFESLYREADKCARQLSSLITYLLRKQRLQQTRQTQ